MRYVVLIAIAALLAMGSCKKCYECRQYCAYCEARNGVGLAYKVCATKSTTYEKVDSFLYTFPDSLYECVLLNSEEGVCDGQNNADDAAAYFQKQDYYCYPKDK